MLSTEEIADSMYLSVKGEAVRRARNLGLI
jgi:hypothetical protein